MQETTYLQNELAKTERSFRIAAVAMAIVLVVFVAYFEWMQSQLAEVLEPANVAEFAVNEARGALPVLTESLKANVQTEAPNLVRYVMHSAIDQVLPLAAQTFETNLDEYSREVGEIGKGSSMPAFAAALAAHKAQFGAKGAPKNEDPALLATRLSAHIEATLGTQLDTLAKAGVQARLDKTAQTLKHINNELVSLAQRPSADRQGQMGKRLITTWWSFVDSGRSNEPGDEFDTKSDAPAKTVAKPTQL
jgi:hypothetical protein